MTWEWYKGRYGTSVRLGGLDATNNAALRRYIVMHRADYAESSHIDRWGRLGRSNGCFAMGEEQFRIALMHLSGGRLLFADSLGLEEDGSIQPLPELAMILIAGRSICCNVRRRARSDAWLTGGGFGRPETRLMATASAIVPASIIAGVIGTAALMVVYMSAAALAGALSATSLEDLLSFLVVGGAAIAVGSIGGTFVVAFYLVIFGLPVALIAGRAESARQPVC